MQKGMSMEIEREIRAFFPLSFTQYPSAPRHCRLLQVGAL